MELQLKNVRIAFAHGLFKASAVKDSDSEPSFSATFLIDPETQEKTLNMIEAAMKKVAKEKWGARWQSIYNKLEKRDRLALHDGDTKDEYDGYEGMYFVNGRSKVKPTVIDRQRNELAMRDGIPYSGCYVNAIVDIYAQDNTYGKGINCGLKGVQFVKHGDPFGAGAPAKADDFDDLGLDEDEEEEEDEDFA